MKKQILITVVGSLLLLVSSAEAQQVITNGANQPQKAGFQFVCSLYGESGQGGSAYAAEPVCALPPGVKIDRTYQQASANFAGGGASTNLTNADVPPGFHIEVDGGHYWALLKPTQLVVLQLGDDNTVKQFGIRPGHMYCGPEPWPGPGCNIKVRVYVKTH